MSKKKKRIINGSMYSNNEEIHDFEYDDEFDKKIKQRRKIGISILVILFLVFVILFLRACFVETDFVETTDNEKNLLAAGKEYFEHNYSKKPTEEADCSKVSLNTLLVDGYIEKKNFVNCKGNDTYVQVCKLESGKFHWTPVMICDEVETYFDGWKIGQEEDLIANQSDVKFVYLAQMLKKENLDDESLGNEEEYWEEKIPYSAYKKLSETLYYRKREKLSIWNINKRVYYPGSGYYVTSPSKEYNKKTSPKRVSKWYKKITTKQTLYSELKTVKISNGTQPHTVYRCSKNANTNIIVNSLEPCSQTNYTYQRGTYKACNGTIALSPNSRCCSSGKYDANYNGCVTEQWSSYTTNKCEDSTRCRTSTKTSVKKIYYPSGASTASKEKTYYASSPATGYTNKDSTTTAYKWYKVVKVGQTSVASNVPPNNNATRSKAYIWGPWSDWTTTKIYSTKNIQVQTKKKIKLRKYENLEKDDWKDVTNGYVTKNQLINAFKDEDENIKTLNDITTNGKMKYKVKMYYRNRVEGGIQ